MTTLHAATLHAAALDALDADELLMLGLRASNAQSDAEALGFYKLAVAREPHHAKAHWALAAQYAGLRMSERGLEHFSRALSLDPGLTVARFQYGLLQLTQGQLNEAQALWQPLDALDSQDPVRLFKDGLLLMVADQFQDALVLIHRAMASPSVDPALRRDMVMTITNIEAAMAANAGHDPIAYAEGLSAADRLSESRPHSAREPSDSRDAGALANDRSDDSSDSDSTTIDRQLALSAYGAGGSNGNQH